MATYNGKHENLLFTCGTCKKGETIGETIEIDLDHSAHKEALWDWLQTHSANGGSYKNIKKHHICECKNCDNKFEIKEH